MGSITSQNAVYTLAVDGVFNQPQQLQGFSADDIFETDDIPPAEVVMGVDGRMSAGKVNNPVPQGITLMPDSASNSIFDDWNGAMVVLGDVYFAQATVMLPSLRKKWVMTNGMLTRYKPIPGAGRLLRPRNFQITWESVVAATF